MSKTKRKLTFTTVFALLILALAIMMSIAPGLFTVYDPLKTDPLNRLQGISAEHICGTDELGRDIWTRIVYGTRNSMSVGLGTAALALLLGVPLGLFAGWRGGFWDSLIMRIMDAFQSFPPVLLAILFITVFDPSVITLIFTIALVSFPYFARIVRSSVLYIKTTEYVAAARSFGARSSYLLLRTILPNCIGSIVVQFSLLAATAILIEASLSFLGMGIQAPEPAWGSMLSYAKDYVDRSISYVIAPTAAIFLVVLSINLLGDAISDWANPKNRKG